MAGSAETRPKGEPRTQPQLKGSPKLGSYLRKLRTGYGYSLRRVEERAKAEGGEIDNSQLSRYEKGICYPSFDKLRVLASVFNVSIQSFSDVVDLESFEDLRPASAEPEELIESGKRFLAQGNQGQAFVHFESALDALAGAPQTEETRRRIAEVRINQASALRGLGKLALAEQELRQALRGGEQLGAEHRARALLSLATIHLYQGDIFLTELEAERAYAMAREAGLDRTAAMAVHTLGIVLAGQNRTAEAIERYRESAQLYETQGDAMEALRVRINIGAGYVDLGKCREGIRLLRSAVLEARAGKYRRIEAQAWSNLGCAYFKSGDMKNARGCFRESDALSVYNGEKQNDLLFLNAFYMWKMAAAADNPTREKIAFGRLKALRSTLERRFAEVDLFDDYVEGGRNHA